MEIAMHSTAEEHYKDKIFTPEEYFALEMDTAIPINNELSLAMTDLYRQVKFN